MVQRYPIAAPWRCSAGAARACRTGGRDEATAGQGRGAHWT